MTLYLLSFCKENRLHKSNEQQRSKSQLGTIEQTFSGVIQSLGIARRYAGWQVVEHWSEIVGDAVAKAAKAVGYTDGTLYLEVPEAVWRQELQAQIETLLARIHAHPGGRAVTNIRFVHGWKGNDTRYDSKDR
jgi:predicted nucleic acid-binding Zn ribbon protein